jgi:hypothetical protein
MLRLTTALGLVATLLTGPALSEPFHHPYGEWREYNRDWLAACPDQIREDDTSSYYGTSCFASTASTELNGANLPVYKLTLIRNRLTGAMDLTFTHAATDGTELDTSRPLGIGFGNDAPTELDFETALETRYNTTNQYYVADPAMRDMLIEAMRERNAATLIVPVLGDDPERRVTLSMRGFLASIDFMETFARRVESYDE